MSLQLDFKRFHRRARYLATKWKVSIIRALYDMDFFFKKKYCAYLAD